VTLLSLPTLGAVHPNIAVLAGFYEGFLEDDLAELLAEEAFAIVGGANTLSGTHRGRVAVLALIAAYRGAAADGLDLDVHDILANDDHGMAIVRVVGRRGNATYDEYETHVFEMVDGRIAGLFVYWNDPAPADAFFA
jgi:ketosteroid isomerase-like protein